MIELIGHFHPLVVHLPIGILLVALLLQLMASNPKYAAVKHAVPVVLLMGVISALLSCITGIMLSKSDDYDQSLINWHMWFGIAVLIVSAVLYTKEVNPKVQANKKLLCVGLLVLVGITGHLGGSLTHGSDYISKPFARLFSNDTLANRSIKPLPNVQEAVAYADVIQPILETKCYSCHNANKRKGGLRMDDITLLMKGGKNGKVIDLAFADSSEILKRMLLPVDNEDHMPPKEKPQPTESQVSLIHWWIDNKADFTQKVKDLRQPDRIKPMLLALQQPIEKKKLPNIPAQPVAKADDKIVQQLRQRNIMVIPVAQNSNYLEASFMADSLADKQDLQLLQKLNKQLISVKLDGKKIAADAQPLLSQLTNLWRLNLANTNITDATIEQLQNLQQLQYLNLVGTNTTLKGILPLQKIKTLQSLYLYKTRISSNDYRSLRAAFPTTYIDSGNYVVPLLATDTSVVKAGTQY